MKSLKLIVILFGIIGVILARVSWAEEKEEGVIKLEEIVVTATKSEKKLEDSPVSVSVITAEDMEKLPILTVEEALQYLPGTFHWKRTGLTEPHPFVLMRGFQSSKRNLSLIDGMTLNYPPHHSINWMSIPQMVIDRIEEVRGPFSSLYGGSAMGGVISFITKTPEKRELKARASYGTFDSMIGQFSYGDKFMDKFSLLLAYEGRRTDGYASRFPIKTNTSGEGTIPVTGWEQTRDVTDSKNLYILGDRGDENTEEDLFYGKLSFDISPVSTFSFSINHYEKDFDRGDYNTWLRDSEGNAIDNGSVAFLDQKIDITPSTFLMGTGNYFRKQTRYLAKYNNAFAERASVDILLGMADTPESTSNTPGSGATNFGGPGSVSETDSTAYFSEIKLNLPIGQKHLITTGVTYERMTSENVYHSLSDWKNPGSKMEFQRSSSGETENWGFFVQDEVSLFDTLTAYIGGRYDRYTVSDGKVTLTEPEYSETTFKDNTESQLSPKLSLHYRPLANTTLRGSIGTSFRGPLISELYKKTFHTPDIWLYGNPNLEPETATSWEIGIVQTLNNRNSVFAATYFESYLDNLINNIPVTIDPETNRVIERRSDNIGKAEIKGIEAEIQHRFTDFLSGFANFTWQDAITKEHPTDKAAEGQRLTLIPEYMFNIGLTLSIYGFDASLTTKYVSKIYGRSDNKDMAEGVPRGYDELFLADLKVGYRITDWAKASMTVNDLFDEEPYYNYKMPGRRIMGTLELTY